MKTREIDPQKIRSIKLPQSFRSGKVFVVQDRNGLFIKKSPDTDLSLVRKKLKKLKNRISQKDINEAIQKARA